MSIKYKAICGERVKIWRAHIIVCGQHVIVRLLIAVPAHVGPTEVVGEEMDNVRWHGVRKFRGRLCCEQSFLFTP